MGVRLKLRVLDLLRCPADENWPLTIHIFEEKKLELVPMLPQKDEQSGVVCRDYCAKKDLDLSQKSHQKQVDYLTDCKDCLRTEIVAGVIHCPKCETFYPIIEEIPIMLRPELRNEDIERDFTEKWAEKIKKLHA
ncbi:MAG: Trm112 family protein [Candidatus Heimdallarchaeota archaeon]|nr:Trm112 family protein [Candidatus Heimdallarchaeota archaeon]